MYKAFAMAYAGATGETREEIKRVFGFGDDPCAVERASPGVEDAASVWFQKDIYVAERYAEKVSCLGLRSCGDPSLRGRVAPDLTVVELRFEKTDVAMYVVMPKSLRDYVEGLTYEKLSNLTDEVTSVKMPLFQAHFRASVKSMLSDMGIRLAFDPRRADFSLITDRERLYIDDVFHGAYIRAGENGVVAAA
jgi:serine protease inhibitor